MSEPCLASAGTIAAPPRFACAPSRGKRSSSAAEAPPKAGEDLALGPITEIPEAVLGPVASGWLSERRAHNRARLRRRTCEILAARGVALDFEPSPSVAIPLIAAAQDEGRETLMDIGARLLATAFDPARRDRYRREFVAIAAALDPIDALCLEKVGNGMTRAWRYRRDSVAKALGTSRDSVDLALNNLAGLGLIDPAKFDSTDFQPFLTPLGREFMAALAHA